MYNLAQKIREECSKMSDADLVAALSTIRWERENIWDNVDPEQMDELSFEYMVMDMDATIDIYELIAKERGLDV